MAALRDSAPRLVGVATALACFEPAPAGAQPCATTPPAVLSEARAARWLVGDDVAAQALVDAERAKDREAGESTGKDPPDYQIFFAQQGTGQFYVSPEPRFPVCTTRGEMGATFYRLRASAAAGLTHTPTQLHRISWPAMDWWYGSRAPRAEG
jgi:hypothetical protein